jgi:hypothetical protein
MSEVDRLTVIARTVYVCDRVSCPHYGEPMTYPCHEDGHAWREEKYVRADQLAGAVGAVRALIDCHDELLNDVGPWGAGYRQALTDLRDDLTKRFGGQSGSVPLPRTNLTKENQ